MASSRPWRQPMPQGTAERYSLPRIEALAAEPRVYAERLADKLPSATTLAEIEARDAAPAARWGRLGAMIVRPVRIRLEHALAVAISIGAPTPRHVRLDDRRLRGPAVAAAERARDVAVRGQAGDP